MRNAMAGLCVVTVLFAAPAFAADHGAAEVDHAWVNAAKANDLDAVMALYAPDAVMYPPDAMKAEGKEAIRENWRQFFEMYEVKDVTYKGNYETAGDLSVGWILWKLVVAPKAGGEPFTIEGRATAVAKKIDGEWKYISDHASVPMTPPPGEGE